MANLNEYDVYIAKPFDTALAVALRFGITEQQLRDANPQWRNRIGILLKPGEEVIMPAEIENAPLFLVYKFQLVVRQRKTADKKEVADDGVNLPAGLTTVTADLLLKINPNLRKARAEELAPYMNRAVVEAKIETLIGEAMFLAQLLHEVGLRQGLHENKGEPISYNGKSYDYFFYMYDKGSPNLNKQKVAKILGNTEAGDGIKFHGRGYIQLTGRDKYTRAGRALGLDLVTKPDLAADPDNAVKTAVWYWMGGNGRNCNDYTSKDSIENLKTITYIINGGYNGMAERTTLYNNVKKALGVK